MALKVDGQLLFHIPILVEQSNYAIWLMKIRNTLSTYGVWEIADGMLTYVSVPAADQNKWKLLDKHMLGLVASTLSDSLINHINYEWTPPVGSAATAFPSVAKVLMDKLHALFGTTGLTS